jgi:quinol monooxygenase YgiN
MYWQVFQVDVQPGRREDFVRGSQAHVEESVREEPGTLAFTYFQDEQNELRYYVMEQYADRAAQQAHAQGQVMQRNAPGLQPLLAGLVLLASGDQVDLWSSPTTPQ